MNISFEQSGDNGTLAISGGLDIETAAEMKTGISSALAASNTLTLDLSGVTSLDLCSMQILCSAHRTATATGKKFMLVSAGEGFIRDMRNAGLARHVSCHHGAESRCLWLG